MINNFCNAFFGSGCLLWRLAKFWTYYLRVFRRVLIVMTSSSRSPSTSANRRLIAEYRSRMSRNSPSNCLTRFRNSTRSLTTVSTSPKFCSATACTFCCSANALLTVKKSGSCQIMQQTKNSFPWSSLDTQIPNDTKRFLINATISDRYGAINDKSSTCHPLVQDPFHVSFHLRIVRRENLRTGVHTGITATPFIQASVIKSYRSVQTFAAATCTCCWPPSPQLVLFLDVQLSQPCLIQQRLPCTSEVCCPTSH